MANDRTMIVCERCGAVHFLTKYYPSTGAGITAEEGEGLVQFYNDHIDCTPTDMDLGKGPLFTICADGEIFERNRKFSFMRNPRVPPLNPPSSS